MRSPGLMLRVLLAAAAVFIPLLVGIANSAQTAPARADSPATQFIGDASQPTNQGDAFHGIESADGPASVESHDRRLGRRNTREVVGPAVPLPTFDDDLVCGTPHQVLSSSMTTLTTAAEPCSVLCRFRR